MKERLQKAQQYIDNAMKEVQDEYWILESRADLEKQADFLGKLGNKLADCASDLRFYEKHWARTK
tara:strand:- start:791 stop:985 length:195 start_codon:yes stop_codon:yes gene_type:complete